MTSTYRSAAPADGWQLVGLGSVSQVVDCKHVTAKFVPTGYPVASIGELGDRYVRLGAASRTTEHFYRLLTDGARRLRPGDLIMSRNATVGRIARVNDSHPPFAMGQDVVLIRARSSAVLPSFLQQLIKSPSTERQFADMMAGSTFKRVNVKDIKRLRLSLPAVDEQARVAGALETAEDLIASLERLIAKKEAIRQGLMQQLLSGRTRLPGFTDEWASRKIGEFAQVKAGGTPSTAVPRYWGGDVPWMSSGEIHAKRVHRVAGRITQDGLRESAAQLLPAGTVLMALAGQGKTRGTVAVSRIELSTNQSIAGILPSITHDPDFLYYNLDTRYDELRGESSGDGGRGGLNLTIIKKLDVLMPPRNEQAAIARVLADADDELDALRARLTKSRAIKTGMMQQLLTGRVRLPEEAVS